MEALEMVDYYMSQNIDLQAELDVAKVYEWQEPMVSVVLTITTAR